MLVFICLLTALILAGIIIVFLINASVIFFGAPFEPTKLTEIEKILKLADPKPNQIFYDLGSGDGRILIKAANKYALNSIGIEINPFLAIFSRKKIRNLGLGKKIKIIWGNFFKKDLSDADIVATYLLQSTNNKLEEKFIKELKPGTKIISKSFIYKNIPFVKSDPEKPELKLYQIPSLKL